VALTPARCQAAEIGAPEKTPTLAPGTPIKEMTGYFYEFLMGLLFMVTRLERNLHDFSFMKSTFDINKQTSILQETHQMALRETSLSFPIIS
jgi:hypothetical protein